MFCDEIIGNKQELIFKHTQKKILLSKIQTNVFQGESGPIKLIGVLS